ncbi:GTPase Era [Cupriavidus laharis]|uniref:GTPase Era n=1 Tax=Cupriavidus laharis TaxID=151654 RepID=A0ABN7YK16_9BURK|nr:dynamin family protein [Cupriavidus laharis]CAG9172500.1 GTPase Era [Cupriavidus laharis]
MTEPLLPEPSDADLAASRLRLLSTCLRGDAVPEQVGTLLAELHAIVHEELPALYRQGSPADIVDLHGEVVGAIEALRQSCNLPVTGGKWIVGFGGAFSAGKSTLINALLGAPLLPAELDPTTSIATYITHGETDDVLALNVLGQRVRLSDDDLRSISHDELRVHGSEVGHLLRTAVVVRNGFPWHHLALADTPGYSKPEHPDGDPTDADRARDALNAVHSIVWVVSADNGVISDSDLKFLSTLSAAIPKVVAVSRADRKSPEDIKQIVALIRRTLAERNIGVLDVVPVSRRRSAGYPLTPLTDLFDAWSRQRPAPPCPRTVKLALRPYARYIDGELVRAHEHMGATNRALAMLPADDGAIATLEAINAQARADMDRLKAMLTSLAALTRRLFHVLENLGDAMSTPMPEPSELDLLGPKRLALIANLSAIFQRRAAGAGADEADGTTDTAALAAVTADPASGTVVGNNRHAAIWQTLNDLPDVCNAAPLLRRHLSLAWLDSLNHADS